MNYFFIENTYSGNNLVTLTVDKTDNPSVTSGYATQVEYSKDGTNWTTWTLDSNRSIGLSAGEKVYFRNNNNNYWSNYDSSMYRCYTFTANQSHNVGGDLNRLSNGSNANYARLFKGDNTLVSAADLVLPSSTSSYSLYQMFYGCTHLTSAPTLMASSLSTRCYKEMFYNCSTLTSVRSKAQSISATDCLQNWLSGVSATGTFYNDSDITYPTGASGIPSGWTEVGPDYFYIQNTGSTTGNVMLSCDVTSDDGALPPCADTVEYSTDGVNWTLETLIDYDEETGEPYGNSISLNLSPNQKVYFRNSGGNWSGYMENIVEEYDEETGETIEVTYTDAVSNIFYGVNSTFTVGGNAKTLLDYTNLNITIEEYSFNYLFNGFTTLTDASNLTLPDITLANNCYNSMFNGCTSLTSAPSLPATTLADSCYQNMFNGCTSLTSAPSLPATTLADSCYESMFYSCSALNEVTTYADDISANNCITNWLQNVSNSGTLYNNGSATYPTNSASGIPTGWTEVGPTPSTYTITATAGSNGSISPSGSVSVNAGSSQTFTVTPDSGYEVDTLTVDGSTATLTNNTYTFSNVQADHTISVTFKLPDLTDYFYIENTYSGTNTVTLTTSKSASPNPPSGTYATSVQYSKDKNSWTTLTLTAGGTNTITLAAGEKVYFRNDSGKWSYVNKYNQSYINQYFTNRFNINETYKIGGNINTLLKYTNLNSVSLSQGCFSELFSNNSKLTDVSDLSLPSTTLAQYCYMNMFRGCTSLTSAPTLPATTLASNCYEAMFYDCTSLTSAPTLPVTTLAQSCYSSMFSGCTALTSAPTLPATTLAQSCYSSMFSGCTALTSAPVLPATTLANGCYYGMFGNCTLTSAPALPATTLASNCYSYMFRGCNSLTTAPVLPATTLAQYCYESMFSGCYRVNEVTTYADDISATNCTYNWLQNVAATGTFHNNGSATYTPNSASGIPTGWTEVLPSKTITATAGQNGSISPSGAVTVNVGSDQTFTFTPDTGYEVDTVTVDGSTVTPTNNTYTFTNVQSDHTISVTFKVQTFTINAISEAHTIVNPSGLITVNYSASQTFTFTPEIGYELDKLYIDGVETAFSGSSYTFTNVQADHTLEITSKLMTFSIEATSSEGGSITPDGTVTVDYDDDATFEITPSTGYLLWELLVDGTDKKDELVDNTYTFENVTANHTIHAVFDDIYLIVSVTSGPNGSITPTGDVEVIYNGNQIFNITPNEGYEIDKVMLDGVDVTDDVEDFNYTMRNIVENHILEVSFKETYIPEPKGFNLTGMKNTDYVKQYKK